MKSFFKTKTFAYTFTIALALLFAGGAMAAWSGPGARAPGDNSGLGSFIDTSSTLQPKGGDLQSTTGVTAPTMTATNFCIGVSCINSWAGASGSWTTSGTNIYNSNSGNVGIGTAGPGGKLDVQGGRSFFSAASEPYAVGARYVSTGGSVYFGATNGTATPDAQIANSGGGVLMTLQNGGNVGIGTVSPGTKLDVQGAINETGGIYDTAGARMDSGGGWIRMYGNSGWYNGTYGGGMYQTAAGTISTYNGSSLNVAGNLTVVGTSATVNGKQVCLADGTNCLTGNTGTITGGGTTGNIPRYTTGTALGNSSLTSDGISTTANGNFFVTGTINAATSVTSPAFSYPSTPLGGLYGSFPNTNSNSRSFIYSISSGYATVAGHYGLSYDQSNNTVCIDGNGACNVRLGMDSGVVTATSFSGAGTGLTGTAASLSIGGTAGSTGILTGNAHTNGTDGWFRSAAATGWYSDTYGVGVYATQAGRVDLYNGAGLYVPGTFTEAGSGNSSFVGNVGIGTTNPNRKLEVYSGNGDAITFGQDTDNTNTIQTYIDGQWANRTTYGGGCCNVLKLNPDVGDVQLGGSVTVSHAGTIYVGSAQLATNGDLYMPWAGNWASAIFCRSDGTNCPAGATPSWASITGMPAFAANAVSGRVRMYEVGCNSGWASSCDADTNGQVDVADTANAVTFNSGLTTASAPTFAGANLTNTLTAAGPTNNWAGIFNPAGPYGVYVAANNSGIYSELAYSGYGLNTNGTINTGGSITAGGTITANGSTVCTPANGLCAAAGSVAWGNVSGKPYAFNQSTDSGASPTFADIYLNNWVRINGAAGIYWQSYGGGWNMSDSSWIRSYGSKAVYMDTGFDTNAASGIGCGGGLGGGYTLHVCGTESVNSSVTASAFYYSSDERLKKNIAAIASSTALQDILALQPVTYNWIDSTRGAGNQLGFIAQQVEKVVPELVSTDASTTLKAVDYARVAPLLVGAIQAQQAQIDAQQKQIDQLEAEVEALKAGK